MISRWVYRWFDTRLGTTSLLRKALDKVFPDHWSFMLGEVALYAFAALIMTGLYLTLFFEASTAETTYHGSYAPLDGSTVSAAYASTVALSFDVRAGLLMRQAHHWAALIFLAAIVVHLVRVFVTGAYRKPRELNWLIGVTMLALALLNGFSGYSMPDDLLSGTGLRIIYSVVLSIPVVGTWLAFLAFGGEFPAEQMVPRLFVSHVLIVPAILAVLVSAHLALIVRQKHTQFPGPGRTERTVVGSRLWPAYTLRSTGLLAAVLAVVFGLGGLVQINPVWIYGPFEPAGVSAPAQPDWYVAWGDGALRLFPRIEFHLGHYLVPAPFLPGVVVGGLTFGLLFAWPLLDRMRTGDGRLHHVLDRPRDRPGRTAFAAGAVTFYTILLVAAGDDILARVLRIPVLGVLTTLRVLVLTLPFVVAALSYGLARALRASTARGVGGLTRDDVRAITDDPPTPTPDAGSEGARLLVRDRGDDTWRWRYVTGSVELAGNELFTTREAAESAARTAYPDVSLDSDDGSGEPAPTGTVVPRGLVRLGAALAWLVLFLLGRRQPRR